MNKICTDIPQSKKLIELGIDVNTADMYYMYRHWEIDEETIGNQSDASIGLDLDFYYGTDNGKTYHYIPAWSLSALLDILPNKQGRGTKSLYWFDDGWHCDYIDEDGASVCGLSADSPIDAAFEMICWLKENNKI